MQQLAPDVLGISKTPWVFGQLVNSRRFFSKPKNLFFDIHGNLGKHLKSFDHALAEPWLGLGVNPNNLFFNNWVEKWHEHMRVLLLLWDYYGMVLF